MTTYFIQTTDSRAIVKVTAHAEENGGLAVTVVDTAGLPHLDFNLTCPLNERGEREALAACRMDGHGIRPLFDQPVAMLIDGSE